MTVHRQWQHSTVYDTVGNGVATDSIQITGDHVVSGGGFAEPIDYSGTQASSTATFPDSVSNQQLPLLGTFTTLESDGNTYLHVAFGVPPGGKARAHIFATWEA